VNRAERRQQQHRRGSPPHRPAKPRPVAYDLSVWIMDAETWNRQQWRQTYGESECPPELFVAIAWTEPSNKAFTDYGVFLVTHWERDADPHQALHEVMDQCRAMMDEKLGPAHWTAGDVVFGDTRGELVT